MSIDMNRTFGLLEVVHKCATIGPGFNNLSSLAMAELKAMDDEAGVEIAKAKAEADKKAAAEAEAKAKVEAEKAKAEEAKAKTEESSPTLVPAGDVGRKI